MLHSNNIWPIKISLKKIEKSVGRWNSVEWQIDKVLPATIETDNEYQLVPLELHQDERYSYRLNLDLEQPVLYLACDETGNGDWVPATLTADQNIAAACLENDTPILSFPMPDAIACWIESYITRHGEVKIKAHRRKHVDRRKEAAIEQRRKML